MEVLLNVCLAIFAGLIIARLLEPLGLPSVTGYLLAGVLIGPYCLGRFSEYIGFGFDSIETVETLQLISKVALGFIAFSIGNEFRFEHLRHIGKQATIVAIFQAIAATVLVDGALIALHFAFPDIPLPATLVLGAIATATAPAATMMVIKQFKAKGPLTNILLPIVALDDAVGLIVFAISFGIAKALVPGGKIDIFSILVNPLLEITCSLLLGAIFGFILAKIMNIFHRYDRRICLALAFVFLTVAICMKDFHFLGGRIHLTFSSLLTCMMLGTVFVNATTEKRSVRVMDETDHWTNIVLITFFVISGAELELDVFLQIGVVITGVVYIIARSLGKYYGARISSKMVGCSDTIQKYLGITLLPQAGVALGMAVTAMQLGGETGNLVRNITLFAVLIYELVGPLLTKISLIRAGEIEPENRKPKLETVKTKMAKEAASVAAASADGKTVEPVEQTK